MSDQSRRDGFLWQPRRPCSLRWIASSPSAAITSAPRKRDRCRCSARAPACVEDIHLARCQQRGQARNAQLGARTDRPVHFRSSAHALSATLRADRQLFLGPIGRSPARRESPRGGSRSPRCRPYTTKTGKPMGFVTIEDIQGNIELVLFPRTWQRHTSCLTVGQIMIVEGKVDTGSTPPKILVDEIRTEIKILESLNSPPKRTLRLFDQFRATLRLRLRSVRTILRSQSLLPCLQQLSRLGRTSRRKSRFPQSRASRRRCGKLRKSLLPIWSIPDLTICRPRRITSPMNGTRNGSRPSRKPPSRRARNQKLIVSLSLSRAHGGNRGSGGQAE